MKLAFLGLISLTLTALLIFSLIYQNADDAKFAAGEYHGELTAIVDVPPIDSPRFSKEGDFIAPNDEVIGVVVDQQAFAFPVDRMIKPTQHVVTFAHQGVDVAVTHCNISGCSRVFTTNKQVPEIKPAMLHVGGLEKDGEMVLMLNKTRYAQLSPNLPLEDYQFKVATRLDWQVEHPDSLYFLGQSTTENSVNW